MRRRARLYFGALIFLAGIATDGLVAGPAVARSCASTRSPEALTALFAHHDVAGLAGADYQRAFVLPDGRILWVFQDAFVHRRGRSDVLVHNVGLVQNANCFTLLRTGSARRPTPWLGADRTDTFHHWFWPLGGAIADDGTFGLFVAEMRERGPRYLSHAEPVATWLARIDPVTLALISFEPARDASAALYGWSVASDDRHTYLYGHCYRQFGFSPIGHDACAADVTVARTALGALDAPLQYWNGTNWVDDPAAAVNIAPAAAPSGQPRSINPMQIAHVDGRWLAVTKDGDWWGTTIYVDEASEPTGPWTTTAVVDAIPLGRQDRYDTYFASLIPTTDGKLVIGLSNNRWDGRTSGAYRPTFRALPDVC